MSDPFAALGLTDTASAESVRAARRDLAKRHHPDAGGDAEMMRSINQAAGEALQEIANRASTPALPFESQFESQIEPTGVLRDVPSFTVEALPVETFEALLVVTTWIGEVLDDDPPYRLDVHLHEPAPCWCRLELVPDAGASTVSITLANETGQPVPNIERVRDIWIDQLNRYDWP
jgi:hypothetical protein